MDIKKFEKIDICILSTYGHCGLDWMTSLLDNHDEVLIMPSFSFFRLVSMLPFKGLIFVALM